MMRWTSVAITTDSLGAGTATTAAPVVGKIYQVRCNAVAFSATADIYVTRNGPAGGTVATILNSTGPFEVSPGIPVYDTAGGQSLYNYAAGAGGTVVREPASADYLTVTVAQGGSVNAGTVHIFYCE